MISSTSPIKLSVRLSVFVLFLLFLNMGGVLSCKRKAEKKVPRPGDKIYPVSVQKASLEDLHETLEIKGSFIPSDKLEVKAELEGKIANVSVSEGQQVAQGEVLATLNPESLKLFLEKQRQDLKEAEARSEANLPLRIPAPLGPFGGRPPETNPTNPPTETQSAASQPAREENRERPVNPDDVGEASPGPSPGGGPTASEKSEALRRVEEAMIDRLKAEIALTEKKIESATIKADIPGVIAKRNITEGSLVNPGESLFEIVKLDPIQLSLNVPREFAAGLKQGDKFDITVNEIAGQTFPGEVVFVSPEMDLQSKTFGVKVSLSNSQQKLKGGMEGKMNLVSAQARKGVMIPSDAVIQKNGKNYVYVVTDQVANQVEVELGKKIGDKVEASKGLKEGDPVVIKGHATFDEEQEFVKVESL